MTSKSKEQISDETKQKWDERIAFLRENYHLLNEWEQGFLDSIEEVRYYKSTLSPGRIRKLYEIYNRVDWKLG